MTRELNDLVRLCMAPAARRAGRVRGHRVPRSRTSSTSRGPMRTGRTYRKIVTNSRCSTASGASFRAALVKQDYKVRVYVPYGTHWYPYFMRRLAERPANLAFFLRALTGD